MVSYTGKTVFSLSPFAAKNLVSQDGFGSPVPRQPARLHSRLNLVLTCGITPETRGGLHYLIYTAIRHQASTKLIGLRNCIPMAFAAESSPAQAL